VLVQTNTGDEEAGFIKIVPVGAARLQEENR
jgi:hypothetical protein